MTDNDLFYSISLQLVPHIGQKHFKTLLNHFKDARSIFKARRAELERINGIGRVRAISICEFRNYKRAEEEIDFIDRFKIKVFCYGKSGYPSRLLHCEDAPAILYFKGNADLNSTRIISIVGTRMPSDYGKQFTKQIIEDVQGYNPIIVSGLAYGIDTHAHKSALKFRLPTVGILAHGLDRIYPHENKSLAKQMLADGGLLTEFISMTQPDACNFPMRNRIIAGLSDAVIVIETGKKGGSMITADIANSYNKDVFALPGRVNDQKSEGCNYLIRENKAVLCTSGADIASILNWDIQSRSVPKLQGELFPDLLEIDKSVADRLATTMPVHIDTLLSEMRIKNSELAAILLKLEMLGLVKQLPGRFYSLVLT